MDQAVEACVISGTSQAGPPLRVLTLNPEMVMRARRDRALAGCFAGRVLVIPDGIGIVLAGRRRGWPEFSRLPGIDLLERLAAEAAKLSWPIFLYGGAPGVAEQAAAVLTERHPGLAVGGTAHGFLTADEQAHLVARIALSGTKLVLVGLGVPRQELWLLENLAATGARIGMGAGGSFDVIAGRTRRAPLLLRRMGLEWAYRVWCEPRRWRRLLVLPGFFWRAIWPVPVERRREAGTTTRRR